MSEIVVAFLSGAVGGSIISALFDWFKEKRKFKTDYLRNQIDKLYGPLCLILSLSKQHFDISKSILSAYDSYFSAYTWSEDAGTQNTLKEESSKTIEVANEHVATANRNNEELFQTIKNNYSLIDLDDIEIVDNFLKNYNRLRIEHDTNKMLPYMIYKMVGGISFLPNDFECRITEKFNSKKNLLSQLSN